MFQDCGDIKKTSITAAENSSCCPKRVFIAAVHQQLGYIPKLGQYETLEERGKQITDQNSDCKCMKIRAFFFSAIGLFTLSRIGLFFLKIHELVKWKTNTQKGKSL